MSRVFKAAVIKAVREGKPLTVTVDDLQYAKEYEEKHGNVEITAIINDRVFTLGVAERIEWPDESRIDAIGQNGNDGDHYDVR